MKSRILIVDDQESNIDLLRRRLQRAGYDVAVAEDGRRALEVLESEPIDLVLLDQMMPEMSGTEVLGRIRATRDSQQLPVIMVTAVDNGAAIAEALDAGADDYVAKPIEFLAALARIRSQLSRGKANARVRKEVERYALATRGSGEAVWDWDVASRRIFLSLELHRMLGLTEALDSYDDSFWFGLVHPADISSLQRGLSLAETPHETRSLFSGEFADHDGLRLEYRIRHQDQGYRWVSMRGISVYDESGKVVRRVGSITDVTRHKTVDHVTGLGSRQSILSELEALTSGVAERNENTFLIALAVERFDKIALSLTPDELNALYRALAGNIGAVVAEMSLAAPAMVLAARIGRGEFAILMQNANAAVAEKLGRRLAEFLTGAFDIAGKDIFLSSSAGIVHAAGSDGSPANVIRDALNAAHEASSHGAGRVLIFDESINEILHARLQMRSGLRRALERKEFQVYYQPRVRLSNGEICGFEALIRWNHPERGFVSPAEFIPVAEEEGLIHEIGLWVLEQACRQTQAWLSSLDLADDFEIAVNLSASQCLEPDLIARIEQILKKTALSPERLKLELTESMALDDLGEAQDVLRQLKSLGLALKIDDFGTGYSGLKYLCDLPFDSLKIDRSFVLNMQKPGTENAKVVRSMIELARTLGMDVIAEGIENADQARILKEMGCEFGQGFLFSRPVDSVAAEKLLARRMDG